MFRISEMFRASRLALAACLLGLSLLGGCSLFESEPEGPALPPDMARRADGKTATAWPTSLSRDEALKRIQRLIPAYAKDRAGWAGDQANIKTLAEVSVEEVPRFSTASGDCPGLTMATV